VTSAAYNAVGHRTSTSDPNMGAWTYTYNALGEVLTRRDARNVTTLFGYDKLGRTTSKSASVDVDANGSPDSVVDTWLFDPPGALGQLWSATRQINAVLEKRSTYTYDTLARPTRRSSQQNQGGGTTQTFVTDTVYDGNYGRPKQLIHPSGDSVWLRYTQYGQLDRESDFPNTQDYRRITAVTARGQSQTEYLGAALTASYAYTGNTGQMTSAIYTKAGSTVRQLGYQYDVFGNVTKQELGVSATTTETYAYDKLMRLTSATRAGGVTGVVSYTYDAVGNFRTKTDYSSTAADAYLYTGGTCGGGPNAVKRITLAAAVGSGTRTLCYDPNGNLTDFSTAGGNGEGFAARYDHDNLPYRTVRGGVTVDLTYDADGARVRQSGADGTRLYDGAYEKLLSPAEHKIYLGDYAVLTRPVGGALRVNFLLKDRLGSVDAVTDAAGTLVETRGSDAFGKPRQGSWADANPPRLGTIANTPRGFTQHEHLNAVALIHMNGRAYDYQLGRFLSVDAVIQFPENSQSLNPYSYLMNSPMAGTDPSGYSCKAMVGSHDCGHDTGAKGGFTSNTIRTKDANGNSITSTETNYSGGARGGMKSISITGKGLSNGALGGQPVSNAATQSVSGSGQAGARSSQGGGGCGLPLICAAAAATFPAGTSTPEIASRGDRSNEGGLTVRGSDEFRNAVSQVEAAAAKAGLSVFPDLRQGSMPVVISETTGSSNFGLGNSTGTYYVQWNPNEAIWVRTSASARIPMRLQSPAAGLIHELGHAHQMSVQGLRTRPLPERPIVDGFEAQWAKFYNEPVRHPNYAHGGRSKFGSGLFEHD